MKRHLISTKWVRLVATVALATPVALALSTGSGNAALPLGIDTELTRFEIDGDAIPGASSNGAPLNAFVNGDWGLVEADFGYGPQPIGSDATQLAPAGIGSTGTLPLVFDQSRADDFPVVDPAPNPQYPTVPGSTEFCPSGEDDNWEGGTKVQSVINIDNPLLGPSGTINLGCGQTDSGLVVHHFEHVRSELPGLVGHLVDRRRHPGQALVRKLEHFSQRHLGNLQQVHGPGIHHRLDSLRERARVVAKPARGAQHRRGVAPLHQQLEAIAAPQPGQWGWRRP